MPAWVRAIVRFLMTVWFRRIEVVGASSCPRGVPLIVIANHENGLIDPMLIAGCLPVAPRFLAKSTLWKNPMLRPLFALARVIPVHRKQDAGEGADTSKNEETFKVAGDVLASGAAIAIFPEGQSHNEPQLQPLKTGAARMALGAPSSLRIVPVGIAFRMKDRFRGSALLLVGDAIDTDAARALAATDERGAVRLLTDRMAEALRGVTINVPTWEERLLLERAVEIAREDESLEGRTRMLRTFHDAYRWLQETHREDVESVRRDVARYDRSLKLLGLTDEIVRAKYRKTSVVRWTLQFLRLVILRTPLGIVGTVVNAIPYQLPRLVAGRNATEADQPASWKLFAAMFIFPAWWALLTAAAGLTLGWEAALGAAVLGPLSGWIAMQWLESGITLAEQAKAFLLLPWRKRLLEELRARRVAIQAGIARLEEYWRAKDGVVESNSA